MFCGLKRVFLHHIMRVGSVTIGRLGFEVGTSYGESVVDDGLSCMAGNLSQKCFCCIVMLRHLMGVRSLLCALCSLGCQVHKYRSFLDVEK